jgi:hypothetical protein
MATLPNPERLAWGSSGSGTGLAAAGADHVPGSFQRPDRNSLATTHDDERHQHFYYAAHLLAVHKCTDSQKLQQCTANEVINADCRRGSLWHKLASFYGLLRITQPQMLRRLLFYGLEMRIWLTIIFFTARSHVMQWHARPSGLSSSMAWDEIQDTLIVDHLRTSVRKVDQSG